MGFFHANMEIRSFKLQYKQAVCQLNLLKWTLGKVTFLTVKVSIFTKNMFCYVICYDYDRYYEVCSDDVDIFLSKNWQSTLCIRDAHTILHSKGTQFQQFLEIF